MRSRYNSERRAWKGRSYKKGGEQVAALKEASAQASHRRFAEDVTAREADLKARVVEYLVRVGEISEEEAQVVLRLYLDLRVVKLDLVAGQWTFVHGGFGDKETILEALKQGVSEGTT